MLFHGQKLIDDRLEQSELLNLEGDTRRIV